MVFPVPGPASMKTRFPVCAGSKSLFWSQPLDRVVTIGRVEGRCGDVNGTGGGWANDLHACHSNTRSASTDPRASD